MSTYLSKQYDQQYFDEMRAYSSRSNHLKRCARKILETKPKTVLDVACGEGYLVKHLRERGVDAWGIDFAKPAGVLIPKWFYRTDARHIPWPKDSFDVVFSSDFFEHVPEERLEETINEMKRVGKRVIALVCSKREKRSTGIDTHVTVKPQIWWKELFDKHGVEILSRQV